MYMLHRKSSPHYLREINKKNSPRKERHAMKVLNSSNGNLLTLFYSIEMLLTRIYTRNHIIFLFGKLYFLYKLLNTESIKVKKFSVNFSI